MKAFDKYREEQESARNDRLVRIYNAAFELFSDNGFEDITMNAIAAKAEIGVASLYRYFSTKEDLAIDTAIYAWKNQGLEYSHLFDEDFTNKTGLEQLKMALDYFPKQFENNMAFFRFIYYFDSFIKNEKVFPDRLKNYESQIVSVKDIIVSMIEKGLVDGSIDAEKIKAFGANVDELYFTITHSLFSTAQKLSLAGNMLNMNSEVPPKRQLELLIKMILESLV